MIEKMTVIIVEQTGHVLAALTREADPISEISGEALARGGLLVRGLGTADEKFEVPPEELKALVVDLEPALLLRPREYHVPEGQQAPELLPTATVNSITLTTTKVTVKPNATAVTVDTKVWVQITGVNLTQPRIAKGTVKKGDATTDLGLETLDTGTTYDVLTLVAAREPHLTNEPL